VGSPRLSLPVSRGPAVSKVLHAAPAVLRTCSLLCFLMTRQGHKNLKQGAAEGGASIPTRDKTEKSIYDFGESDGPKNAFVVRDAILTEMGPWARQNRAWYKSRAKKGNGILIFGGESAATISWPLFMGDTECP
jgi:hypothetical protein